MRALIASLALFLTAAACNDASEPLKIGGKDFTESSILSEMMAALAEDAEIPVTRRLFLGSTLVNLEALKRGDIDVYAEYNGTGLVMVGQPAISDGDRAMERVRSLYQPLGLIWGQRFGFSNTYGLAMRRGRAEELGVSRISDLVGEAGALTIGVDENFSKRPLDGLDPMSARYGMTFGDVSVVGPEERTSLYDMLLAGEADVIDVFTTDGQIADLDLLLLEDDLDFFPVYQAAPLVRADALVRFPELQAALDELAGRLDGETMRRLNAQVDVDALSARKVARAALADMGLIEGDGGLEIAEPVRVAVSPFVVTDAESGRALRAVREAYPGRRVALDQVDDAFAEVADGAAPLAIAAAVEFADLESGGDLTERPFEAIGVVGRTYLHVIGLKGRDGPAKLSEVTALATGPEGSASHRAGRILATAHDGMSVSPQTGSQAGDDPAAALAASGADAALVLAPLGSAEVEMLLENGPLLPLDGWEDGANLVRFPQLREARIPAGTYAGQSAAVDTLSSQLVLAVPVVTSDDVTGPQGPGATQPNEIASLPDKTVLAIDKALDTTIGIDPAIPRAPALATSLPEPPASVTPSAGVSALTAAVFALFIWLIWLYARPERR